MKTAIMYTLLLYALLVAILSCAHDPLIDLICRDAPDKRRCIEEHTRR